MKTALHIQTIVGGNQLKLNTIQSVFFKRVLCERRRFFVG